MYRKLIPAAVAAFAFASVAAVAAPAPKAGAQPAAATSQQAPHHRAKLHHVGMTVNDDRETSALNRLEVAGYTSFKDVKMQGQNVSADVAKGGKFQHVEVTPAGTITPAT